MASPQLPATYKGLFFPSASEPAVVTDIPTPPLEPGSAFVKPLYSWIPGYSNELYTNGNPRQYNIPFPVVGGTGSIGRVVAVGPDSVGLSVGDLVTTEPLIRIRDHATMGYMLTLGTGAPNPTLPAAFDHFHHGTWGELVRVPLENVHRFNEEALRRQGIAVPDLAFFAQLAVPYGGLRDVGLRPGETVLITPATGSFGGAAVHVALALGARVIAMGRNESILAELKALAPNRIDTAAFSGNEEADIAALSKFGPIDVYYDMTPAKVQNPSHVRAGILSVRPGGRISFSGAVPDFKFPYTAIMQRNLTVKGTLMYSREQAQELVKMIETGVLRLGPEAGLITKKIFKLEEWEEAIETAAKEAGAGRAVLFAPTQE